jgi:hypothetical protein
LDTQTNIPPDVAASQHLFQIGTGYMASTALWIAAKLDLASKLAAGPRAAADLARETGANEDALYRILRLLSSVGVFEETAPRTFANNLPSSTMVAGAKGSTHPMMLWIADPTHLRIYADALHSVMTGTPAMEKTFGIPVFEFFPRHPEISEVFNNAMTNFSAYVIPAALDAYDFNGVRSVVDVAGGHGHVLMSILQRHPDATGVLFDLDHVIAGAIPRIREAGLEARIRTESGDFFKAVPAGADAYVMKHIIHDWDDEKARMILGAIRAAMKPEGRVVLLETVLSPANQPDFGKLLDLEMMLLPGGRERTEEEFRALFASSGFTVTKIVPTSSPLSVIEARQA